MSVFATPQTLKKLFFIQCFLVGLFITSYGQDASFREANPLAKAAPHLPKMVRYNGAGREFHGAKYSYNADATKAAIKAWIKTYPEEVAKYKSAASEFFKKTDEKTLSGKDQEHFYDLKSQWLMISQYVF